MTRLGYAFLLSLALLVSGCAEILDGIDDPVRTIRHAVSDIPEDEERDIGEAVAEQLLGAAPPVDDPELQRYINHVGMWVASHSDRPDIDWTFAVIDADTVNAFATPGGYIFLSRGLFLLLEDEAELAGILGHEIAHVTERHHLDELQRHARRSLAFDMAEQAAGGGLSDERLRALATVSLDLYDRGLDRGDELEADRIGATLAAEAGYDPWAMLTTLSTLDAIHPEALAIEQMSATHPPARERQEALVAYLESAELPTGLRPTDRFRAMRARLAAESDETP